MMMMMMIFHTSIQIALSSNHILLVYIAYLISSLSYQCLKVLLHFKQGSFAPPALLNERQEGCLLPSAPLAGVPGANGPLAQA